MTNEAWLLGVKERLIQKMPAAVQAARAAEFIPYYVKDGVWQPNTSITAWTNGSWPATMWQMLLMTGDAQYALEACRAENMLDEALRQFDRLSHDTGFMWKISSGVHYALTGDAQSRRRALLAAQLLASRYNVNGFLRAWNQPGREGYVIIDTLLNLPLLYWASKETGDPRFRLMARTHAETVLNTFQRPDGSVCHIVVFDPETGAVLDRPRGQGYAPGSAWSRGQAWAIYGFALTALYTGESRFLEASSRAADFFMSHLPPEGIPPCDFAAPPEPAYWDDSASCAAACGMLCLKEQLPSPQGEKYEDAAWRLLRAAEARDADWSAGAPSILARSTAAYHADGWHNVPIQYADYFFTEAVNRLLGEKLLFW